jgi:hypothetical protein
MRNADPFAPDRWELASEPVQAAAPTPRKKRLPRPRKREWFLKGPVPWSWLARAMALPGKALAVGLILWREKGWQKQRTVHFSLARAAGDGIPRTTARRAIRALERAGLVKILRKPGRGLEVTLLDSQVEG